MLINAYTTVALLVGLIAYSVEGRHALKIKKCCPPNEVIDIRRMKCGPSGDNTWTPVFYKDTDESSLPIGSSGYQVVTQKPTCPAGVGVHILPLRKIPGRNIPEAQFRLLKDGRLVGKHSRGNWIGIPENACIDGIMNYEGVNPYTGDDRDQAIISCPVIEETNF